MNPPVSVGSPRTPAAPTDHELYRGHFERLRAYTDALREDRCRRTGHFEAHSLGETVGVFAPLFAPWNMEIVFALYMRGGLRFNEAKRLLAPVSSRVLSDKLAHLTREGLVRPRGEGGYELTVKGDVVARHLHPLLFFLHEAPG